MVGEAEAARIDEEIKKREKLLAQMPSTIRTRVAQVKAFPGEVVSRIQQINGVLVEFQKEE